MGILEKMLGRKPSAAGVAEWLARLEAEAGAGQERLTKADAALGRIAEMSDVEHAAALAERDAAHRALARIGAQMATARGHIAELEKVEAVAAAQKERDDADRRLGKEYPAAASEYEKYAALAAGALARMAEIDAEVARVNRRIVADNRAGGPFAGFETIKDSTARFRAEPDQVEPDRTVVEEHVMIAVPRRKSGDGERLARPQLSERRDGRIIVPPGGTIQKIERVIPGRIRPGRRLSSPAEEASLPAARVGAAPFWPPKTS